MTDVLPIRPGVTPRIDAHRELAAHVDEQIGKLAANGELTGIAFVTFARNGEKRLHRAGYYDLTPAPGDSTGSFVAYAGAILLRESTD